MYDVPLILREGGATDGDVQQLVLDLPRYFEAASTLLLEPSRELSIDYGIVEVQP